jgi:hypothetical protein
MKRIHLISIGVCLIVAASAIVGSFLVKPSQPFVPTEDSFGVCLHLSDFNASTEAAMIDLGVRLVRIDWEIGKMGSFMQDMAKDGISVLAIVDHVTMNWSNNFALQDWQGNVSAIMASDEAKSVSAWEIWNEPNAEQFFFGYMDGSPEHYFDMLKNAYSIIKSSSNASIVCAGLAPNESWLQWHNSLNSLGAEDFFDIQGMHLYGDLSTNVEMINLAGSSKPIWVTEIGKPSAPAPDFTEADQAAYVVGNISPLLQKVDKVFWYELIDNHNLDPPKENYFGLLDIGYSRKPAFTEFKGIIEELPKICNNLMG